MGLENTILGLFEFLGDMDFRILGSLLGLVLVIFWIVIVGWVWIDSGDRTTKREARVGYIFLVLLFNIPGLIIYFIIRPNETIEEIYWADLERRYLKFETAELGDCPKCGSQLFPGYIFCTSCGYRIRKRCPRCNVLVDKHHKYCEFCGFQIRDRAVQAEKYPDAAVMEQQIIASKEHATQTVESKRTRYKTGNSFVVKLGSAILSFFSKAKVEKGKTTKEKDLVIEHKQEIESTDNQKIEQSIQKPGNQSKKKKKRKKKR